MSSNSTSPSTLRASPFDEVIAEFRRLPRADWLDQVRIDQSHRWRGRAGVSAEEYFRCLPEMRKDEETVLVVINGEMMLRTEMGETGILDEFRRRFPELADRITVQYELSSALAREPEADEIDDAPSPLDLPGYTLLEQIGAGSCGVVYRARQQSLARDVAIKIVRTSGANARQLARQRQEAEILGRLQHPNVVHLYEVLHSRSQLYLVMELVAGTTLAHRIGGRPLPAAEAAELTKTLARAVQAVHEAGVLHRDLKPSNVLITPTGEVKITDFGLAKLESQRSSLTAQDSIIGTPSYMAPEQAVGDGHASDARADVYSLGAVLYELLTGRPPFLGATVLETLAMIRSEDPVPPTRLLPRLPRDLETICLKCLAKGPQARYSTAMELADDLDCYMKGLPIAARPPALAERLVRAAKRRPAVATAMIGVVAVAGVVAVTWRLHRVQQQRLAESALVEAIASANIQALPQFLSRMPRDQSAFSAQLRAELADAQPPSSRWVNLAIAEALTDSSQPGRQLLDYLPAARPQEIPLLAATLAELDSAVVLDRVHSVLTDESASDDVRLRAACVAASISPNEMRWQDAAPAVARALVWQHPVDVGTFTSALRPVGAGLVPSLVALYYDDGQEPVAREVAAGILAQFAAGQATVLAELIVEADPTEFRLLLPSLTATADSAIEPLRRIADRPVDFEQLGRDQPWETRHAVEAKFDDAQRRRAVALTTLWRLGRPEPALAALSGAGDPALRSWLIETLGSLGVAAEDLLNRAIRADNPTVRQALLLSLGSATSPPSEKAKENLVAAVLRLYRQDGNAGVHGVCRWLLSRHLDAGSRLVETDRALAESIEVRRDWYLGPNGHTFSILRGPMAFTMGSPSQELSREEDEAELAVRLEYDLAVSATEVTVAQFLQFRDKFFNRRYSANDDCPANNITWFDAAGYCRWLSEQEGLPEDQMCYPPLAKIGPDMRLPADWRERTGYRLPTEAEWEYACRGGVEASRFPGEGKKLLDRYAWFIENSDDHAWPVGRLRPNNFGLFDMLGNVTERCFEQFSPLSVFAQADAAPADEVTELTVDKSSLRPFRGANFGDAEHNLRSARRNANLPTDEWALIGFRPVRVIRP